MCGVQQGGVASSATAREHRPAIVGRVDDECVLEHALALQRTRHVFDQLIQHRQLRGQLPAETGWYGWI